MPPDSRSVTIGFVTVLFKSDDVLPDFFASLAKQINVRVKLYVLDNSPTDSGYQLSRRLAEQYGIDAVVIFNDANLGVAKGNNQGIAMALRDHCEIVLIGNNDTVFSASDTLERLVEPIVAGKATMVTPKIKYFGTNKIWCAGGTMVEWRGTTLHTGETEEDRGQFEKPSAITYAPTCFMAVKSAALPSPTPMDEKYFVYYDDTDFVFRMTHAGHTLYYTPAAEVFHKVSFSTGGDETDFSIYYLTRNRVYFILKNLPLLKKLYALMFMTLTRPMRYQRKLPLVIRSMRDGVKLYFERAA
jgi:hypothetical protein